MADEREELIGQALKAQARAKQAALSKSQPTEPRSAGVNALRAAEFAARGFTDRAFDVIGAIPDLVSAGMRQVGIPTPQPGFYADAMKGGFDKLGRAISAPLNSMLPDNFGPNQPEGAFERGAYGFGGGVADAASMAVPGAAVARTARAGGQAQNIGRVLASQPVVQGVAGGTGGAVSEATGSDAAGLAAALAVPTAAGIGRRAITPVGRQLAPEEQRLANLAEQMGIRLTPGQATGSVPLQTAESSLAQLPFTSGPQHAIYDAQRTAFNRAAMQTAGVNADRAAPAQLEETFQIIGARLNDVIRRTPQVNIDPQFDQAIAQAVHEYGRRLPTDVRPVFDSYVDDIAQMTRAARQPGVTDVSVDGQTYQNIASDLRRAGRTARENPALQNAIGGLQEALDGAMQRSVPRELATDWAEARRNYRNLLQIDKAMAMAPQADAAAGNIPFGGLSNAVRASDPRGFARGRGDLNNVARVGMFLGSTKIPDSGTANRSNMIALLKGAPVTGGAAAMTGSAGAMMTGGDPLLTALSAAGGAATTGLGYATPRLAQAAMNSRAGQAYLRNNMAPGPTARNRAEMLAKILAAQTTGNAVEGE